jgi:hypothetical protein
MGPPKHPSCPKPVSSNTINRILGIPSLALNGAGQAGEDLSAVLLITPGKVVPGLYSGNLDIIFFLSHIISLNNTDTD